MDIQDRQDKVTCFDLGLEFCPSLLNRIVNMATGLPL